MEPIPTPSDRKSSNNNNKMEKQQQQQQQQQPNQQPKRNSKLNELNETERVRNRFISHEFHKLDRTKSRIDAPPSFSDSESESDSEFFLTNNNNSNNNNKNQKNNGNGNGNNGSPTFTSSNSSSKQSNLTQRKIQIPSKHQQNNNTTSTTSSTTTNNILNDESSDNNNNKISTPPKVVENEKMTMNGLFTLRPSLLSSESGGSSYRGFLNLLLILLITASFRLVILNHMLYGVRINLDLYKISEYHRWPGVMIGLTINFFIIAAYLIEKMAAKQMIADRYCYLLRILNCAGVIIIPSASIVAFSPNPASGIIVMIMICTFSMKIISYAYENSKQRKLNPDNKKFKLNDPSDTGVYPNNLSLRSTYWFMLIPTLVYQLSYPRSPKIRKGYLIRRIIEALSLSLLILWMANQYMLPLVQNSISPMEKFDIVLIAERIMKLSLPNLYVWLLGFYVFFHLYLNIVAEITRFGDREFYRDWWNSTGLDYFWRTWNMPVHHWMVVLIYTPMRRRGFSKNMGYFMCFFVSAVFHELVISIPFHSLKLWGFFGIMSQMVLIALTKNLMNGRNLGNVIFWISIVLGQPLIVLLYYRNFVLENPEWYNNEPLPTSTSTPIMPFY